jgi:hypothetical protein
MVGAALLKLGPLLELEPWGGTMEQRQMLPRISLGISGGSQISMFLSSFLPLDFHWCLDLLRHQRAEEPGK